MKQFFELSEVMSSHSHQWGLALFFVLYLLMVFIILYRDASNRHEINVALSMCVLAIIRYFPPLVNFFSLHFFKGHEFARVGWGMLVVPVIAYGVVNILEKEFKQKKNRIPSALMLVLLCFLIGGKTQSYFKIPSNIYKIPQEALDIEYIISESMGEENSVGVTFYPDIGQNYSDLDLTYYGLVAYGKYTYNAVTIQELNDGKYGLMLTQKEQPEDEAIWKNYKKVGETDHVIVYKRANCKT